MVKGLAEPSVELPLAGDGVALWVSDLFLRPLETSMHLGLAGKHRRGATVLLGHALQQGGKPPRIYR
jgi:hypothetical protein